MGVDPSCPLDILPAVGLAVAVRGEVVDAQVNAQEGRLCHLAALRQIGLSLLQAMAFLWDQAAHAEGKDPDLGGGQRDREQHADQEVGRPGEDAVSCA